MLELGWFSTGRGEGSRNLLRLVQEQIAGGSLPARIQFVFCNREQGEGEGSDGFMDLGMTAFVDVGSIWEGGVPFGADSGPLATAGAGLRIGFPGGTGGVVRIDVAFPLNGAPQ